MNNINLLPKVPLLRRFYIPLLMLLVALFVIAGALICTWSYLLAKNNAVIRHDADLAQATVNRLRKEREVDPLTKNTAALAAEIQKLKTSRRDWSPVLDAIIASLPANARMVDANAADLNSVTANCEFSTVTDLADYVAKLQHNPLIAEAAVKDIHRLEKEVAPKASVPFFQASITVKLSAIAQPK
ncbi:hypothetical protein SD70_00705 [Gordoniibacillus kamchatkensis]|uniref:Uncharacterized protein n=1 Tax=Gordoniibacillus kamchatkensis TaxID=1590651 RepID=A0ABR5AQ24_9BACL|nr:hypothetical protein [Paenibacillus sp. VKM B-2647]KIL42462.1 hypothetical protein SD70_00705 [Paenibacillus sp. VKM B-2647]